MTTAVVILLMLPALVSCSGEGNIRLLEEDVSVAMKACSDPVTNSKGDANAKHRRRRSNDYARIDNDNTGQSQYAHERRPDTGVQKAGKQQIYVLNATDYDYAGYGAGNAGERLVSSYPRPASGRGHYNNSNTNASRTKRSEPLLNKPDMDMVDSRGIPREIELWNKVQASVTSQQSRTALHDQIRTCFQKLQSEAEDDSCSYSNKLERCLMLRFSDRKNNGTLTNNQKT